MSASASLATGTLPRPRTRLIGREQELVLARTRLLEEAVPLLTLSGPGGVGKTRLALAIAHDTQDSFTDRAIWVDLAPLADPSLVASSLVAVLDLVPVADRSLVDTLVRHLHARQALLVLDNCEHVLPECAALVSVLLDRCPALQVLSTSRAPLRLHGEQIFPVEPLPLPVAETSTVEILQENEAVRLFVERAQAVQPAFHLTAANGLTIGAICRRLDGLPLAIELAAARIPLLSPDALLAQVTDRLRLLGPGPRDRAPRQQTIEATIAWSYELLNDHDKRLFRQLAVFAGGFTSAAAQAVAGDEQAGGADEAVLAQLATLVEQSLLRRVEADGEPRFMMLETIREFGLAQLAATGEEDQLRGRQAAFFLGMARTGETFLRTREQARWLDQIQADHANMRSALTWALENGQGELALQLAGALGPFWRRRGYLQEGLNWLERAIVAGGSGSDRLAAAFSAVTIAGQLYREPVQLRWATYAVNLAREVGTPSEVATAQRGLAAVLLFQGDLDQASALLELALRTFQRLGDQASIASTLINLAQLAQMRGEYAVTRDLLEQALQGARAAGGVHAEAGCLHNLADLAEAEGDGDGAIQYREEAIALSRQLGSTADVMAGAFALGVLYADHRGDDARAEALIMESLAFWQEVGDDTDAAMALFTLGRLATRRGELDLARARYLEHFVVVQRFDEPELVAAGVAEGLVGLGGVARARGDTAGALISFRTALINVLPVAARRWEGSGQNGWWARLVLVECLRLIAATAGQMLDHDEAARLLGASSALLAGGPFGLSTIFQVERDQQTNDAAPLRARLGEHVFAKAHAAGQRLSFDEAVALALKLARPLVAESDVKITPAPSPADPFGLTPREQEVLVLLCQRLTNKEIAETLYIGTRTVQSHTLSIFGKLGVDNRRDAAALAVKHGLA